MRLTNNTQKLLCINAIFLLSLVGLLTGVWMMKIEKSPTIGEVSRPIYFQAAVRSASNRITKPFKVHTCSALTSVREEQAVQKERSMWNQVQSLSVEDLYVNYAYEIAHFYYPNVDPSYVCAIIYHESRFDPNVTNSRTGVQGLTQINPKWHTKRAERLGVTNLYSPYGNIMVCFDILNEMAEDNGLEYALNFFAGGYPYASRYRNSLSPFISELDEIVETQNFSERILPYYIKDLSGGEIGAAG